MRALLFSILVLLSTVANSQRQGYRYVFTSTSDTTFAWFPYDSIKSWMQLSNVDNVIPALQSGVTALSTSLNSKQNLLISGTNIKTINGSSVLGSGNLVVSGNGVSPSDTAAMLSPYLRSSDATGTYAAISNLALKMNLADTNSMLSKYVRTTDANATYATIPNLALKINISDSASMLSKYLRSSDATATYATIANLNLKANIASPTFTGTVSGITSTMVGLGNVTNESKATMFTNPTFTGTVTIPNSQITNAMLVGSIAYSKLSLTGAILNADLAGSIDASTKLTGVLPFANGGIGASAATSATTGTMTVNMTTETITITPTNACTFNASGGVVGQRATFVITTSGTSSFTLTWGTNFRSTGTLATGTTTAKVFTVSYLCTNATPTWVETSRTTAQ